MFTKQTVGENDFLIQIASYYSILIIKLRSKDIQSPDDQPNLPKNLMSK